jgi:hypothetical protein
VRIPLGVHHLQSRPNVTADAAGLCLNPAMPSSKGGSEALRTSTAIAFSAGGRRGGLPAAAVATRRRCRPARAGRRDRTTRRTSLIAASPSNRRSGDPTPAGICHVTSMPSDLAMAERIAVNAKVQRPGVQRGVETLLVPGTWRRSSAPRVGEPGPPASALRYGERRLLPRKISGNGGHLDHPVDQLTTILKMRSFSTTRTAPTFRRDRHRQLRQPRFLAAVDSAAVASTPRPVYRRLRVWHAEIGIDQPTARARADGPPRADHLQYHQGNGQIA